MTSPLPFMLSSFLHLPKSRWYATNDSELAQKHKKISFWKVCHRKKAGTYSPPLKKASLSNFVSPAAYSLPCWRSAKNAKTWSTMRLRKHSPKRRSRILDGNDFWNQCKHSPENARAVAKWPSGTARRSRLATTFSTQTHSSKGGPRRGDKEYFSRSVLHNHIPKANSWVFKHWSVYFIVQWNYRRFNFFSSEMIL